MNSNPTALELTGQCHGPLDRLEDDLREARTYARLLEEPLGYREACERLARVRDCVDIEIPKIRVALGLKP